MVVRGTAKDEKKTAHVMTFFCVVEKILSFVVLLFFFLGEKIITF